MFTYHFADDAVRARRQELSDEADRARLARAFKRGADRHGRRLGSRRAPSDPCPSDLG